MMPAFQDDAATVAFGAFDQQAEPMESRYRGHQAEAQPRSHLMAAPVRTVESSQDSRALRHRDPSPRVIDPKRRPRSARENRDRYRAAWPRELHCVVDEI